MDSKQRKEFWDTLCSLEGSDIQNDSNLMMNKIVFPHYLYRYRDVTFNNLAALKTNHLYFSSANYYDDPFDTFLHSNCSEPPHCRTISALPEKAAIIAS